MMEKVDAQSTSGKKAHSGIDGGRSQGTVSGPMINIVAVRLW